MNRRERRAARASQKPSRPQAGDQPVVAQMFALATRQHQSGQYAEAERLYRDVLAIDPDHPGSLHHLGILAHQMGQPMVALELIGRALAINDDLPECHNNIGMVLAALGRFDEAAEHFRRAIAMQPGNADAYANFGNVLKEQGQLSEAIASYDRALALHPDFAAAHNNRAAALLALGRREEARSGYERALQLDPNFQEAHSNLGVWLLDEGRVDEAVSHFERALLLNASSADAHNNLGRAYLAAGNLQQAGAHFQTALTLSPAFAPAGNNIGLMLARLKDALDREDSPENRELFVWTINGLRVAPDVPGLRELVIRGLLEHWGAARSLSTLAMALIAKDERIRAAIDRAGQGTSSGAIDPVSGPELAAAAEDELLAALLVSTHILDVGFERFLTRLRATLLHVLEDGEPDHHGLLPLACALARCCFYNEYVFDRSEDESARVQSLRDKLDPSGDRSAAVAFAYAVVAAYGPLNSLPRHELFLTGEWPEAFDKVLTQQIREPAAEQALRASIPALTAIENEVSRQVRAQYEDNPYPRWTGVTGPVHPTTLYELLRQQFPSAPRHELATDAVDYLIAGCGTRQAIDVAQGLPAARILAIDLSLSSLSYTKRIAEALRLQNLQFGQADIMQLGSIGRDFDVIDSMGVLHHMADPWAGWRVLRSLLRPHGLMRIGLYSEIGRSDIVAARNFAAQNGFTGQDPEDIRRYRQRLLELPDDSPAKAVTGLADFFSTSECRDLLLHVQEHRMTLPAIRKFLDDNGLAVIGLVVPDHVKRRYAQQFPGDDALTDLENWHRFEQANPRTFLNMYELWVQSRS